MAAYLHDIGNVISRHEHGPSGAIIALHILEELDVKAEEVALVCSAIGNHEEETGDPVNPVAAAMILGDKTDGDKSRVRNPNMINFDIHDRVNYAVGRSFLRIDAQNKEACLELSIDTKISQVMEYIEIFLDRMTMCRRAAAF